VLKKNGVELKRRMITHLGDDPSSVKQFAKDVGFINIKFWYQPNNQLYKDGEQVYDLLSKMGSLAISKNLE